MPAISPTQEQQAAIDCPSDMVMVARPGSGKTSVVATKIRRILPELSRFQGVIAISYTNKASEELARRCKEGAFDVKQSFFGTIDDFCLREIIRPFSRHLTRVHPELKTVMMTELPDAIASARPVIAPHEARIWDIELFLPLLQTALGGGVIPLELAGMLACHIVDQSPACRRYLKARYRAVFIDEYQDSDYFQHQLFLKLRGLGLTAVAVGDADQSIFEFAHKYAHFLRELAQAGSGFAKFEITENHRSHPSINDFALRLLDPTHVFTRPDDPRVFLKSVTGDQIAIAHWLRTAIPGLMRHFHLNAADRVAILCQGKHSTRLIGEHLGLSNHVFERSAFQRAPSNEAQLFSSLLELRQDRGLSAQALVDRHLAPNSRAAFKRVLRHLVLRCRSCPDSDLAIAVADATARLLGQPLSTVGLKEIEAVCANPALLAQFKPPPAGAIQIMTLHKSKGLEFDLVFHADLHDHVIPRQVYPSGPDGPIFDNEQQWLNLHYVGITRAKHACVLLTSTLRINSMGETKRGAPSQFLGRNGANAIPIEW